MPRAKPFPVVPTLWVLVIVHTAIGLRWSPTTCLRKVTVVGATEDQKDHLRRSLKMLTGVSIGQADGHALLSRIQNDPSVLRADWQQNLFGRGKLKIRPQFPVGLVDAKRGLLLSSTGELFLGTVPATKLPQVVLPENAGRASLTLIGNWEAQRIAELCGLISTNLSDFSWKVVQENNGRMTIISSDGARVVLGTTDRLANKIGVLRTALDQNPKLMKQAGSVNLSAENNPVIVPRAPAQKE